ncbi:MAG: 4Fe-4S binding protein [Proteobacteria bacterium]|nr:4Fe-4S binding protein [Pseudomonadota bacterium]
MKMKRNIIEIDEGLCNGCGQCVSACAEGAIELINGKATLVSENYCDGLAACIGECPEGALKIVEREAEAFDTEAVEQHFKNKEFFQTPISGAETLNTQNSTLNTEVLPCGCPSTHMQIFSSPCEAANHPSSLTVADSSLMHWPVQIKLIPPTAPFLKNADILVAADCTPVAYPAFHKDFLKGRTVLIGCPKFDDTEEYINKFAEIFKNAGIRSVTVLIMEVPCCSKLPVIVRQGMELSGEKIPMEIVVISASGKILKKEKM